MAAHKTSAWPLALVYAGLIVYASLYPFAHWRDQGVATWLFLMAPLPRYWTGFDVVSNVLGYMPLGFLLVLGALRSGHARHALVRSVLACAALSLLMESLQVYLPDRVPSNLDWFLNALGSALGAASAWGLEKLGWLQRWSRFRAMWFVEEARGALVLLALWPLALLYPLTVPLGLGQVLARLHGVLAEILAGSPFLPWLPGYDAGFHAIAPMHEWLCVCLGMLIPCLMGFGVVHGVVRRAWLLLWVLGMALAATALSSALSFGPAHVWTWLTPPVESALLGAVVLAAGLLWVSPRAGLVLAVLLLGVDLSLVNQVPRDAYFEQTLFMWEQGRFIRFHGLAQWLGWIWPYAALAYVLSRLWGAQPEN